jgi:thiol-disulfide isomerase/thioredoxin
MTERLHGVVRPFGRITFAVAVVGAVAVALVTRREAPARAAAFEAIPAASAPIEETVRGVRRITTREAPERIVLDSRPPESARLLFYDGRSTQPTTAGALVVDSSGAVLHFSDRLQPRRLAPRIGTRRLLSAAPGAKGGVWVADVEGDVLMLAAAGEVVATVRSPFASPRLAAGSAGQVWVVRSTDQFPMLLPAGPSPVAVRLDERGEPTRRLGTALIPEHGLLTELDNAGYVAARGDTVYYAPFIRDEIVAYGPAGDTLWVASRSLPQTTVEPRFEVSRGHAVVNYHPVNLGLTIGLDGNIYVLSTPGFSTTTARLDVLDPQSGRVLRTAALRTAIPTLAADSEGRVYTLDPVRLLSGTAPAERPAAPPVTLPLMGGGEFSLERLRGKVVLINLWASWCTPCRVEMPALDSLRRQLADTSFVFVAISEDHDVGDARHFIAEFGFDFPVPLGRGALRDVFHYPGLPYTILLDRNGRVVQTWIGGVTRDQVGLMETVIRGELARGGSATMPGHAHMHMSN